MIHTETSNATTTASIGGVVTKVKRNRRPWVYKDDFDRLQWKYSILKKIAIGLLIALSIAVKLAI